MKQGFNQIQEIPIFERKWLIDRSMEQKQKEEEHLNKSNSKSGR